MRVSCLLLLFFIISICDSQSSTVSSSSSSSFSSSSASSTSSASTYANSSPFSSSSPFTSSGSSGSSASPGSSGSTNSFYSTTSGSPTSDNGSEKLVTYTTGQKTIFICVCGGTFVLLIALAILSGLSDTIARSKQKTKRTHA